MGTDLALYRAVRVTATSPIDDDPDIIDAEVIDEAPAPVTPVGNAVIVHTPAPSHVDTGAGSGKKKRASGEHKPRLVMVTQQLLNTYWLFADPDPDADDAELQRCRDYVADAKEVELVSHDEPDVFDRLDTTGLAAMDRLNLPHPPELIDHELTKLLADARKAAACTDNTAEAQFALREAADALGSWVIDRWEDAGAEVSNAFANIHNRDLAPDGSLKVPHLHLVVEFALKPKSRTPQSFTRARLAELIGMPSFQRVVISNARGKSAEVKDQTISRGLDVWLAYLIHAKDLWKFQYSPAQVASLVSDFGDYLDAVEDRSWSWHQDGVSKTADHEKEKERADDKALAKRAKQMAKDILHGELTLEEILLSNDLREVFGLKPRMIEDAFRTYFASKAMRAAVDLRNGVFHTLILYINGSAGSGKTLFANKLVNWLEDKFSWACYRGATGNSLDDYGGEEVIWLDDARPGAMTAAEWLLLFDPYNASPARARYRNKQNVAPRVIIVTTTLDPASFFFYSSEKGEISEAIEQFLRRLCAIVQPITLDELNFEMVGDVPKYSMTIKDKTFEVSKGIIQQGTLDVDTAKRLCSSLIVDAAKDLEPGDDYISLESRLDLLPLQEAAQIKLLGQTLDNNVELFMGSFNYGWSRFYPYDYLYDLYKKWMNQNNPSERFKLLSRDIFVGQLKLRDCWVNDAGVQLVASPGMVNRSDLDFSGDDSLFSDRWSVGSYFLNHHFIFDGLVRSDQEFVLVNHTYRTVESQRSVQGEHAEAESKQEDASPTVDPLDPWSIAPAIPKKLIPITPIHKKPSEKESTTSDKEDVDDEKIPAQPAANSHQQLPEVPPRPGLTFSTPTF